MRKEESKIIRLYFNKILKNYYVLIYQMISKEIDI